MGKYLLVVPSSALPGRDDEYNDWYDNTHLEEFLALPGVVSCRRFEQHPTSPSDTPGRYLALVEIEAEDPMVVFSEMAQRAGEGAMSPASPALDPTSPAFWLYTSR